VHLRTPLILLLLGALAGVGCDGLGSGVDAYRDGRYDEAFAELSRVRQERGDGASPELHYDVALAALRVSDWTAAETAAKLAGDVDGAFDGLRDFVLGTAAFGRCELAEVQAGAPEAEPFAYDLAIGYAKTARGAWQDAATSRTDWPAARRNVDRATLEIAALERKKSAAQRQAKKAGSKPRLRPVPTAKDPPKPKPDKDRADDAAALDTELPPEQVLAVLETLARREQEKRKVRRTKRREQPPEVEQDW
jgi:hypothetical protein